MIEIKPIKFEEAEVLRDIAIRTFEETFGHDNEPDQLAAFFDKDLSLDILKKELKHPDSQHYFIRVDGEPAGYLKLNRGQAQTEQELANAFEIQRLYLLRAYQGRGLGQKLLEFTLERACESGCDWAWLGVWEHNIKAQSLYQKYGFEKFSEHLFAVGDKMDRDWLLRKPLARKGKEC